MRELHDHKTNQTNEQLVVSAVDDPGAGGASHRYCVMGFNAHDNPSSGGDVPLSGTNLTSLDIVFQNGPIPEKGVNGITSEALLAILIDRHRGFSTGMFPSKENSMAVTYLESALLWLQKRTNDRIRRGVEGKLKP